jgi:hypothetical protein
MTRETRDPGLDALLDLDGQVLVVDPLGGHWVKFVVRSVPVSPERPHGLDYALTLHGTDGGRLAGFDNAHPPWAVASAANRWITGTGSGPCVPTTTRMGRPCSPTSGRRWTQC